MASISFNQIQLRIIILLLALFLLTVVGYRGFVERPKLAENIMKFSEREVSSLNVNLESMIKNLSEINYDYSVWTSTYNVMDKENELYLSEDYIEENFIEDTFISLKIDGILLFDNNFQVVFKKGFAHKKQEMLDFTFDNFDKNPQNIQLFPEPITHKGVPQKTGIIVTTFGPAMVSTTQIRRSDKTGQNLGYLSFIRLIDENIIKKLALFTMTKIEMVPISSIQISNEIQHLSSDIIISEIKPYSDLYVDDLNNKPAFILRLHHHNSSMPLLIDTQSLLFVLVFAALLFIIYGFLSVYIVHPVLNLTHEIKKMEGNEKAGLLDENQKIKELANISKHFNALMTTVQRQNEILSSQAYTDVLTKITNRRGLEDHLEAQRDLCVRNGISFTVVIVDVDHFKLYNDTYGHIEGDNALYSVAQTLNVFNKRAGDMCARYGGEEFVLVFSHIEKKELDILLAKMIDAMATLNIAHKSSPTVKHLTVSLGACVVVATDVVDHHLPIKSIIRAADTALYEAKNNGRNQFVSVKFQDSYWFKHSI